MSQDFIFGDGCQFQTFLPSGGLSLAFLNSWLYFCFDIEFFECSMHFVYCELIFRWC